MTKYQPGLPVATVGIEIEAEERDVGLQRAAEQRMDLLLDRTGLAAVADRHCRHRIHDRRRIAAEQDAAHEQHDLLAGTAGRLVFGELARAPVGDRRDVAVGFRTDRAPEAAEERRARIVHDEVAPQQLAPHLDVEAEHEGFDEALIRLEQRDAVDRHALETGQQPVLRQRGERFGHRLREHAARCRSARSPAARRRPQDESSPACAA